MFSLVFPILVLSTSTPLITALVCATNCSVSGQIGNVPIPRCDEIDKPATEQSCRVHITIDYFSNEITGYLKPGLPLLTIQSRFETETGFSLYSDASNITMDFVCSTGDLCDGEFLFNVLESDWINTQTQAKALRQNLAEALFNASDLRPTETCPSRQPCSDQGFCEAAYSVDTSPTPIKFESTCANSTETPVLGWIRAIDYSESVNIVYYTCNKLGCASQGPAASIFQMIQRDYVLPFNVTITTTTTTTTMTVTTTTSTTTTSTTTSKPSAASSIQLNMVEQLIFVLSFLLLQCFFDC